MLGVLDRGRRDLGLVAILHRPLPPSSSVRSTSNTLPSRCTKNLVPPVSKNSFRAWLVV